MSIPTSRRPVCLSKDVTFRASHGPPTPHMAGLRRRLTFGALFVPSFVVRINCANLIRHVPLIPFLPGFGGNVAHGCTICQAEIAAKIRKVNEIGQRNIHANERAHPLTVRDCIISSEGDRRVLTSLNARQCAILTYLLDRDGPAAAGSLASRFGTSLRTIRYDLEAIRASLKGTGVQVEARPRSGVWIEGLSERRAALRSLLCSDGGATLLSPAQREDRLFFELLSRDSGLTYPEVCDLLSCSRTTVLRSLIGVERRLKGHGLRLERIRGGVKASGSERDRREALVRLLVDTMEPADLGSVLRGPAGRAPFGAVPGFKPGLGWGELMRCMNRAEKLLGRKLTAESSESLVMHLAVAIQRVQAGQHVTMPASKLAELKGLPEWPVAVDMAGEIRELTGLILPEPDLGYVVLHLVGSRTQPLSVAVEPPASSDLQPEAVALAERLIEQTGALLGVDLTGDVPLRNGLAWHLQGLVTRQRFRLHAANPLKAEIQEQMGRVYAAVSHVLEDLQDPLGQSVTDDEKGFLTVHLAAALERLGQSPGVRVLVVCSTGLGSAQLLAARLVRVFKEIHVVGVVSALDSADNAVSSQADLVITTVALPHLPVPSVRVSPLLGPREVEQVRAAIRAVSGVAERSEPHVHGHPVVESLMAVIPAYAHIRDAEGLRRALAEFLVTDRPPLELIEPIIREVALLGIQVDPTAQAGLAIHLQLALPRFRAGDTLHEPGLERFRTEHRSLFRAVERGLELFGRWHGVTVPADEVVPVMRYILRSDRGVD